jgi:hypothetical protein
VESDPIKNPEYHRVKEMNTLAEFDVGRLEVPHPGQRPKVELIDLEHPRHHSVAQLPVPFHHSTAQTVHLVAHHLKDTRTCTQSISTSTSLNIFFYYQQINANSKCSKKSVLKYRNNNEAGMRRGKEVNQ